MVALMSVGYGDIMPITYMGQAAASIAMLIGIITLVLPLSIIQTSFREERLRADANIQEKKAFKLLRNMIEQVPKDSGEKYIIDAEVERMADQGEEFMLLPALKCLKDNLSETMNDMPVVLNNARQLLAAVQSMREGVQRHDTEDCLHQTESGTPKSPASVAKVYLSPESINPDVHEDEYLPTKPGSKLTGKTYQVPIRDLRRACTFARSCYLASVDVMARWDKAHVDDRAFEHLWYDEKQGGPWFKNILKLGSVPPPLAPPGGTNVG